MRASEWIVLAYFTYLAVTALVIRPLRDRRRRVAGTTALIALSVLGLGRLGESGVAAPLRDWLPVVYLLAAYWLPARLAAAPNETLERVLLARDHRWLGRDRLVAFTERGPRALIELLELAYLFCYAMVPMGLACLYGAGLQDQADPFWTAVLASVLPAYGVLPWFPTRPPRALEASVTRSRIRPVNLAVLDRGSIQLNTFPSGHAAAAVATALAVGVDLPLAGFVLGLIALGILIGSVVGRYHYAADAISGTALAVAGFVVSRAV